MSYPVYTVPAGDVLPIFFDTFDGGTGASISMAGLAVTDIEIYKDGSATQRASDAGYTLLDTDGIDFDEITGIHGFSIDTSDNTDAGFYVVGSWYHVVVSSVTIDGQTVSFVAAAFRIMAAEAVAGVPVVDMGAISGDSTAANNLETACDGGSYNVGGGGVVAASVTGAVGSVTGAVGSVAAGVSLADDAITSAKFDESTAFPLKSQDSGATAIARTGADSDTLETLSDQIDLQATAVALSTHDAKLDTVDNFLDTEVADILADTNELQAEFVDGGRLDLLIDAIKAKTDLIPASPAGTGDIPSAATIADAVLDEALGTHTGFITTLLTAAGYTAPANSDIATLVSRITAERAGYLDAAISGAVAPTVEEIDTELSTAHGEGDWTTARASGAYSYSDVLEDAGGDPISGAKIEAYSDSDRSALVTATTSDGNGAFTLHFVTSGTYYFRAVATGYDDLEFSGVAS